MTAVIQGSPDITQQTLDLNQIIKTTVEDVLSSINETLEYPEIPLTDEEIITQILDQLRNKGYTELTREDIEQIYVKCTYDAAVASSVDEPVLEA